MTRGRERPPRLCAGEVPKVPAGGGGRTSWRGILAALALLAACSGGPDRAGEGIEGTTVEVLAVWQDAEAGAFERVLDRFEQRTGATVRFTSTEGEDVSAVLDRRLDDGRPPDLAVLPQPAAVARYARSGDLLPLDDLVGPQVRGGWSRTWRRLGTVDGSLYGVWFKAAHKSLVWYSIAAFEDLGVVPPSDLDGLREVARAFAGTDLPAFSLTGVDRDAWTLTDWFENLYLRQAGPDRYDALAERRLPWTDPSVVTTLRTMGELLGPDRVVRAAGSETDLPASVAAVFDPSPAAAMVVEGDFVPGVVAGTTEAELGVDVDVFAFPGVAPTDRYVVGGGDAAVLMRGSPGGEALLRFLVSAEAGEAWAAQGGFVSPNEDVALTAYRDPTSRRIARSLLEAGDGFRFDLSDLQPVAFGQTTGAGMWAVLTDFVADPSDPEGTAARLEAEAAGS